MRSTFHESHSPCNTSDVQQTDISPHLWYITQFCPPSSLLPGSPLLSFARIHTKTTRDLEALPSPPPIHASDNQCQHRLHLYVNSKMRYIKPEPLVNHLVQTCNNVRYPSYQSIIILLDSRLTAPKRTKRTNLSSDITLNSTLAICLTKCRW